MKQAVLFSLFLTLTLVSLLRIFLSFKNFSLSNQADNRMEKASAYVYI